MRIGVLGAAALALLFLAACATALEKSLDEEPGEAAYGETAN